MPEDHLTPQKNFQIAWNVEKEPLFGQTAYNNINQGLWGDLKKYKKQNRIQNPACRYQNF